MKVIHKKLTNILSIFSVTALLALSCSFLTLPTYAENLNFSVNVKQSLTVSTLDANISLEVDPSSSTFDSQTSNITISTNNPKGYQLVMSAGSTDLSRAPLADGTIPTLKSLEPVTGGYDEDSFTVNSWGYKVGTGNYQAFELSNLVSSSSTPVNEDSIDLTFATKVDYEQAAGTYSTTIVFEVVTPIDTEAP